MLRMSSDPSFRRLLTAAFALVVFVGCDEDYGPSEPQTGAPASAVTQSTPKVISRTGDITGAVADFRAVLGAPANTAAGEQPTGRREINWDGVSGAVLNVDNFPADFFNARVPRGTVFAVEGGAFRVSDNDFSDVDPTYGAQFEFFSANRTFAPISARGMDVLFQVAGETTPALVSGFGVVFSDVDIFGPTSMEYFDKDGRSLGRYLVPARSDAAGLSFLGVDFGSPIVARVRIASGTRRVGDGLDITDGGRFDLVVMDDFLLGEPHPIDIP